MSAVDELTRSTFTHDGVTRDIFTAGEGPAVIVLAEIPGITEKVAEFALMVRDLGCSVWLPRLFGVDPPASVNPLDVVKAIAPACVSKEFAAFARGRTAPVTTWLRAFAAHAHAESGGPGVGVIGMCFTGGFVLGMMVDDIVLAPVLSQPSLPIGVRGSTKSDLHLSPEDLVRVKERADDGICVLGLRFSGDPLSPPERFASLRRVLGDKFIDVEIDSSKGNPWGIRRMAHSVVTEDLSTDDPTHPTTIALGRVLDFFRDRLLEPAS